MKDFVNRVKSFLFFDFPLQPALISANFNHVHTKLIAENPEWSTSGTKQKLIYQYWSVYVIRHFYVLYGLPALLFLLLQLKGDNLVYSLITIIIVGTICYFIFYLFHYRPEYCTTYLPILETVKESYDRKQFEHFEKCRQAQLSNFSLALFFYVLTKTNRINAISCDDYSANLLRRLYGVDSGSMKKNLELILGTVKRKNMSNRKITEIRNRFAETYDFLEALEFSAGIERLKELETSFFKV
jgi:hypothetical protein